MESGSRHKQQTKQMFILLNALHTLCVQEKHELDDVQWSQLLSLIRHDETYPFEISESNRNYTHLRQFYMNHFKMNNGKRNRVLANFINKFILLLKNHRSTVITERIVIKLAKSCNIRQSVYTTFAKSAWCCHLSQIALPYDESYRKMSTCSVMMLDKFSKPKFIEINKDESMSDNEVHNIWSSCKSVKKKIMPTIKLL